MNNEYKRRNMIISGDERIINLLDRDGIVNYYGKIMTSFDANRYFELLLNNILWKNDKTIVFGKAIVTKRKVAWYGDSDYSYTYSNSTKQALAWTKELLGLKHMIENVTGSNFNSCLLNLYHNGNEGIAWHSDDEESLGRNNNIASLSLGAERKFLFKHKLTKQIVSILLEHGSLLIMKGSTQTNWLHSLPKSKRILQPRINLTFRSIIC
jgi:alkylated DNA repair dioxygenase AlkB